MGSQDAVVPGSEVSPGPDGSSAEGSVTRRRGSRTGPEVRLKSSQVESREATQYLLWAIVGSILVNVISLPLFFAPADNDPPAAAIVIASVFAVLALLGVWDSGSGAAGQVGDPRGHGPHRAERDPRVLRPA